MRVLLTITRDKRNIYCGHVFLMNNLLIEQGRSTEVVQQKVKAALTHMYEIAPNALQIEIRGHHSLKAANIINRLKRKGKAPQTEVWFNSSYFDIGS